MHEMKLLFCFALHIFVRRWALCIVYMCFSKGTTTTNINELKKKREFFFPCSNCHIWHNPHLLQLALLLLSILEKFRYSYFMCRCRCMFEYFYSICFNRKLYRSQIKIFAIVNALLFRDNHTNTGRHTWNIKYDKYEAFVSSIYLNRNICNSLNWNVHNSDVCLDV